MPAISAPLLAAALGFVTALCTTPIAIRLALRFDVLDHPRGYKAHGAPTPLLGGLAIAVATIVGSGWPAQSLAGRNLAGLVALATGVTVILVAGLLDDTRGLDPARKLGWQLAATALAGVCLAALGVRLKLFLGWPSVPIVVLTVLWIVAITNAMNFLDNMDGLCAGLGAVAASALAIVNFRSGELFVSAAAAALAGACAGFLPYNWPKAHVFLGDTGSMFVGFTLASLSVMGVYTSGAPAPALAVLAPLIALAIPVLDAVLVVLLRLKAGHPPWLGDRRHLNHRLVRRGLRPAAAVATLWAGGAAAALVAVLVPTVSVAAGLALLGGLILALIALATLAGSRGLE